MFLGAANELLQTLNLFKVADKPTGFNNDQLDCIERHSHSATAGSSYSIVDDRFSP